MFRPFPLSFLLANNWLINSFKLNPRCWKTPVSLYWAKTTSSGDRAAAEPTAIPSSPAETYAHVSTSALLAFKEGIPDHVETEASLSLCLKHDSIHNIHYSTQISVLLETWPVTTSGNPHAPETMFLYHDSTSSSLTSRGTLLLSTTTPSESITLYVEIAGWESGVTKVIFEVNLLFTAPGNWTLQENISFRSYPTKIQSYGKKFTDLNQASATTTTPIGPDQWI